VHAVSPRDPQRASVVSLNTSVMMSHSSKKKKNKSSTGIAATARGGTLPTRIPGQVSIVSARETMGKIYSFDLNVLPMVFTVAAGAVASRQQFLVGQIYIFAKLLTCFQEFRFRGVRLTPQSMAGDTALATTRAIPGYILTWIDETILTTSNPASADAISRTACSVPIDSSVQPDKRRELQWTASDTEDLDWVSIKNGAYATFVPFTVCAYAAVGNAAGQTGTVATTGATFTLRGAARVEFRGLVSS